MGALEAISPLAQLDENGRRVVIDSLIAKIKDPSSAAEIMADAQDKLSWFAHEITEWFQPTGYKLLVYIPYLSEKTAGGVLMPEQSREQYEMAAIYAVVLKVGSDAYQDAKKFPNGPWCREGDIVMIRAYAGTRFKRQGYPFMYALINDDTVDAVLNKDLIVERPH